MAQDSEQGDFEPLIDTSADKVPPKKSADLKPRVWEAGAAQQPPKAASQPPQARPPVQGIPPGAAPRPAQGVPPQQRPPLQQQRPVQQGLPGQRPPQGYPPQQRPPQQNQPVPRPAQGHPPLQARPGQQPAPLQRPAQMRPQQVTQAQRPVPQQTAPFPQQQADAASRFRQPLPQKPQTLADSLLSSVSESKEGAAAAEPPLSVEQKKKKIMMLGALILGCCVVAGIVLSVVKTPVQGTRADIEKLQKDLAAREAAKVTTDETQSNYDKAVTDFRIKINGGKDKNFKNTESADKFEKQVFQALQLIYTGDKNVFNDLKQYVYTINKGPKTGFFILDGIPTIMLDNDTAFRSPTWAATIILHQYFHARQYYEREKAKSGMLRPPMLNEEAQIKVDANPMKVDFSDANSIEAFERKADNFAIDIMQRINAPRVELNMLRARPAGDYELTHTNSTPTESK